jgi:hypothetical protein
VSHTAALHQAYEKGPAFAGPGLPSTANFYITLPPPWLRKGHTPPKSVEVQIAATRIARSSAADYSLKDRVRHCRPANRGIAR